MLGNLGRWIGKDREEVIFLPVLVFGYLYVEFDKLTPCFAPFSFGFSERVFLLLTVVCVLVASILYTILNSLDSDLSKSEARDKLTSLSGKSQILLTGFVLIYICLLIASMGELVLRLCHQDLIIIGLTMFYLVLITVTTTDVMIE